MNTSQIRTPYLYILMRTDMTSMNPGKAVAQGAHAANQFVKTMRNCNSICEDQTEILHLWEVWENSAVGDDGIPQGFGTTITLGISSETILFEVVETAKKMGCAAEVTFDPSYPLVDGDVVHLIPLHTCGYVFGDKNHLSPLLRQFNLHP